MEYDIWKEFLYPRIRRMYQHVRHAGKYVMIHSCGDEGELFDDLIDCGLNWFNPFQPEVMNVDTMLTKYRGRLAFHGGLSMQRTLPFGSPEDVHWESEHPLGIGAEVDTFFRLPILSKATHRSKTYRLSSTSLKTMQVFISSKYPKQRIPSSIQIPAIVDCRDFH